MKKSVRRKKNFGIIIAVVLLILIVLVFLIGYFNWDKISGNVVGVSNEDEEGVAGGVSAAAVKPVDGVFLSVATLKDSYKVGEKILLTDPPDEMSISGKVVEGVGFAGSGNNLATDSYEGVINSNQMMRRVIDREGNLILESNKEEKIKSKGYIIEFVDKPLVLKEKELAPAGVAGISASAKTKLKTSLNNQRTQLKIKRETIKNNIKVKLGKKSIKSITGNAVALNQDELGVLGEYENVFNGIALDITSQEAEKVKTVPGVKSVSPNLEVHTMLMDSVPLIGADKVWQLDADGNNCASSGKECLTGKNVTIAIIDTGIDYTHKDLGGCFGQGCKVEGGYDFVNNDNDPMDDQGHGTHVAGIAAGTAGNGIIKGVAPGATLYAYKVLDSEGGGYWNKVIAGIDRAVDPNNDGDFSDKVDIISMSLGGLGNPDDRQSNAVDNAVNVGVVAVIAAGNSGPSSGTIGSPGCARKAITVGATDKQDKIAGFSSRGPVKWIDSNGNLQYLMKPDIVAPGVDICSAEWGSVWSDRKCFDEKHVAISGTSMATPMVAGAAALLKQKNPDWSPEEIKQALKNTANDLGYDFNIQGYGRVNILKDINLSTKPFIVKLITNGLVEGIINISGTIIGNNFESYSLYYGIGLNPSVWVEIKSGNDILKNNYITSFNSGILPNMEFITLKLSVNDNSRNYWEDRTIIVANNLFIKSPVLELYNKEGLIEINGTVFVDGFDSYVIRYSKEGENPKTDAIILKNNGKKEIINNVLGYLNLSKLEDGIYNLTLEVSSSTKGVLRTSSLIGYEKKLIKKIKLFPVELQTVFEPTIYDLNNDGKMDFILPYNNKLNVFDIDGSLINWPYINNDYNLCRWGTSHFMQYPAVAISGYNKKYIIFTDICNTIILDDKANLINNLDNKFGRHISGIKKDGKIVLGFNNALNHSIDFVDFNGNNLQNWPIKINTESDFFDYAIGDLNKDGRKDIIVRTSDRLKAFELNGNILFDKEIDKSIVSGPDLVHIILADLDNDNKLEIICPQVDEGFNAFIQVFDSEGNKKIVEPIKINPLSYGFIFLDGLAIGDIDGDKKREIIFREERKIKIFYLNGTILWEIPVNSIGYVSTADLNGDKKDEIIYIDRSNKKPFILKIRNFENSISADYILEMSKISSGANIRPMISDFNNDKKTEIAISYSKYFSFSASRGFVDHFYYTSIFSTNYSFNKENIKWQMYHHDSQMTGNYDYSEESLLPQSKLVNTNTKAVSGTLYMYLQKKNAKGKWVVEKTVVDKQKITIPANGLIKLDVGKDNKGKQVFKGWNNLNVVPKVKGDYRVFAGIVFNKNKTWGIWEFRVV